MRLVLTLHRKSCTELNIKIRGKIKTNGMVKRAKRLAIFEREMKVKNQESGDKSRRGLKGGSVGVNGPCP